MDGKTGACEECVRSCQLLHWSKKDLGPRVTRFFKIMIGTDFSEALFFPPKFAKTVKDSVDQEIEVEDSSGTCWTVTLSYYKGLLGFHKGWSEFSHRKDLQVGDFLVVNHIEGGHFVIQVFGRDGCERLNVAKNHPPVKRAWTGENIAAEITPCQATCRDAKRRKSSRTSTRIQQTETNCSPDSECGTEKQLSVDDEFYLMLDREAGFAQSDHRTCLYDLSSFEMPQAICSSGNSKKPMDGQEGSADHAWTIVKFQADRNLVDKNPTERVVSRKEAGITSNVVEKNKDSGPMDDCINGDHISNVAIPCQNPNRSSGSLPQNPLSINRNLNEEFKMVEKVKVEMTELSSGCGEKRVLEPYAGEEDGSSFSAPEMNKVMKIEPVYSLDVPSTVETSFTCLAETNGSVYIDLPDPLPLVTFHRGREGRTTVILEDPAGRDWPCIYHEKFCFHVLVAPWRKINEENAIQPGDHLIFTVVDASLNKYRFDVVRKPPEN